MISYVLSPSHMMPSGQSVMVCICPRLPPFYQSVLPATNTQPVENQGFTHLYTTQSELPNSTSDQALLQKTELPFTATPVPVLADPTAPAATTKPFNHGPLHPRLCGGGVSLSPSIPLSPLYVPSAGERGHEKKTSEEIYFCLSYFIPSESASDTGHGKDTCSAPLSWELRDRRGRGEGEERKGGEERRGKKMQ